MGWKALSKTEWNESLQNSYWWLFIISNNLTFFCVLLQGLWPLLRCNCSSLSWCVWVCVWRHFAIVLGWTRGCASVLSCARAQLFMVNKQLLSPKVFQRLIRSWGCNAAAAVCEMKPCKLGQLGRSGTRLRIVLKIWVVYWFWQHSLPRRMGQHLMKCPR